MSSTLPRLARNKSQTKARATIHGDLPIELFEKREDWAKWLDSNHVASSGVWLRLAKKASGLESVTYAQALEAALCHRWIDGQKRSYDHNSWLQKFSPRGKKSIWSKINREKALELIKLGRIKPAGLAAVKRAKEDGRWDAAYASPSGATAPSDLQAALNKDARAKAFFGKLNRLNRYAILHRIQTAKKAETRTQRIIKFVQMLAKHETLYP